jgi:putative colanic acid biosynthesis acetyltransferase WcaF
MILSNYNNKEFDRGRPSSIEILWLMSSVLLVSGGIPGSFWRRIILKIFGAKIGQRVVLRPGLKVKFPWYLEIGDDSWIGEGVWIDNLAKVRIGSNVCISQGAYLCTGSHDASSPSFNLITKEIQIEDCCWICARANLAPGTYMECGSVLSMGTTGYGRLKAWMIYTSGKPEILRDRRRQ